MFAQIGDDGVLEKRKKIIICFVCILPIIVVIGPSLFLGGLPQKDIIQTDDIPLEFNISIVNNYIDFQTANDCSAYASAYVMRHLGQQITGPELYSDIRRVFGFVPIDSVVHLFQNYGYDAKACHGDISTMKQRLVSGTPIIAFTRIPDDTHYIVIVGYDEDFIYLEDSLSDNSNADGGWYNRKLRTEEFEEIWKTNMYPVENIYIVIREK